MHWRFLLAVDYVQIWDLSFPFDFASLTSYHVHYTITPIILTHSPLLIDNKRALIYISPIMPHPSLPSSNFSTTTFQKKLPSPPFQLWSKSIPSRPIQEHRFCFFLRHPLSKPWHDVDKTGEIWLCVAVFLDLTFFALGLW